jgi:hypothetical protein
MLGTTVELFSRAYGFRIYRIMNLDFGLETFFN